jgi:cytochrome bd ubiquinol oxidase subunit II
VVLDGFDIGAGIIPYLVTDDENERRLVLRSIGPVWDGNEVWLVAAGGTLFFSFPVLYARSFSGFYLPLMMILWLLILRACGIELRGHIDHPLWRSFWDFIFSSSSTLLAIFLGVALGNVIRGVPLDVEKLFFEPLWTNFEPEGQTGILDWYTLLTGVVALIALALHGANYLALKTNGEVQRRARRISQVGVWLLALLIAISLFATLRIRPEMTNNYKAYIWSWMIPLTVFFGVYGMYYFISRQADLPAFLCSAASIAGMLFGASFGLYPNVLPSTLSAQNNLTIWNSAAQPYGLRVGAVWWVIGMALAIIYFIYLYRSFRGKSHLRVKGIEIFFTTRVIQTNFQRL